MEVLPYLLLAMIAAVVVPGFLYSQAHRMETAVTPGGSGGGEITLEMIGQDHAAFDPGQMLSDRPIKMAGDKLANR
ncbi:MAG: hypothetical protein WBZ35_15870 [Pseudolabrys sp.]